MFFTPDRNVLTIAVKCVCAELLSFVRLFGTPWTVTHQAPLSMEFPGKNTGVAGKNTRQEYSIVFSRGAP